MGAVSADRGHNQRPGGVRAGPYQADAWSGPVYSPFPSTLVKIRPGQEEVLGSTNPSRGWGQGSGQAQYKAGQAEPTGDKLEPGMGKSTVQAHD